MINNMGFGSELPLGLAALLARDSIAMDHFSSLGGEDRQGILDYLNGGLDDEDSEYRLSHTAKSLHDGVPGFYRQ